MNPEHVYLAMPQEPMRRSQISTEARTVVTTNPSFIIASGWNLLQAATIIGAQNTIYHLAIHPCYNRLHDSIWYIFGFTISIIGSTMIVMPFLHHLFSITKIIPIYVGGDSIVNHNVAINILIQHYNKQVSFWEGFKSNLLYPFWTRSVITWYNSIMESYYATVDSISTQLHDLKVISQNTNDSINSLKSMVRTIAFEQQQMNSTIERNTNAIYGLKSDVSELKSDVSELKSDMKEIKSILMDHVGTKEDFETMYVGSIPYVRM